MERDPKAVAVENFLREGYRIGRLNVESNRGDLSNVPFQVLRAEDKGILYNPAIDPDKARRLYAKLYFWSQEFQDSLGEFELQRADGCYQTLPIRAEIMPVIFDPSVSQVDFKALTLPSLFDDRRLYFLPCVNCGKKFSFSGRVSLTPEQRFTSAVNVPLAAVSGRGYRPVKNDLMVDRNPILVNSEFNDGSLEAYVGAIFEVASAILEPATTVKISRRFREGSEGIFTTDTIGNLNSLNDEFIGLAQVCQDEEKFVADSIAYK